MKYRFMLAHNQGY